MNAHDFARKLLAGPDLPLMILDSFNGGGEAREINSGPTIRTITQEDEDNVADCEGLVGQRVLVIGFGCYEEKQVSEDFVKTLSGEYFIPKDAEVRDVFKRFREAEGAPLSTLE